MAIRCPRLVMSLRVLLLLVLVLCLWLGGIAHKARQQRIAVAAIRDYGGFVRYDWEYDNGHPAPGREPQAPKWMRRLLGDEFFQEVVHVSFVYDDYDDTNPEPVVTARRDDRVMPHLRELAGVRTLLLHEGQATDAGLSNIRGLTRLEELYIWDARELTDAGLAHLAGLKNLKTLHIDNSRMTNAGLAHLKGLANLEYLALQMNHVTDGGLAHFKDLTRLRRLSVGLGRCEVTDAGLVHLRGLKNLESLDIQKSRVTDEGLMQLKESPSLREIWVSEEMGPITRKGIERLKAAMPNLKTVE